MAYHTLLDAAYAMYYPEAEFGIKDMAMRAKKRLKRTGKSLRAKKNAFAWNAAGGRMVSASPSHRAVMRDKAFMNQITRPAHGRKLGKRK